MTNLPLQLARTLINRTNARGMLAVAICGAATLAITPATALADNDAATFWTQFAPSEDTRLIFVSSSQGSDTNSGFTPNEPVKTLDRAYELLRDGHPDWMLLRRGDVWYESLPRPSKSGRGPDEKLVIGAYGDDPNRPQIRPADGQNGMQASGDDLIAHVAFVGLHLEPASRDNSSTPVGIRWLAECDDILLEDLYVSGFSGNVVFQAYPESNTLSGIRLNGCVIVDSWSTTGHSQGMYAKGVQGLLVEHSVFASNGFNADRGAVPTIFNHNIYIQNGCTGLVFRDNIIADASSHGLQLRPGGVVENNIFISNPLALLLGGGSYPEEGGVNGTVRNNLVMYGRDIADNLPRAFGFTVSNIREADISNNYFTINTIGANRDAISIGGDRDLRITNLDITHNMILDWNGSINLEAPAAGQTIQNVNISSNAFYRDMTSQDNRNLNKPFIEIFEGATQSQVEIENNEYNHFSMHDRPFRIGTSRTDAEDWFRDIEPSGVDYELFAPPPELGLQQYLESYEVSGDMQDFIQHARQLSRSRFDSKYTAASVINWFEQETQERAITLVE